MSGLVLSRKRVYGVIDSEIEFKDLDHQQCCIKESVVRPISIKVSQGSFDVSKGSICFELSSLRLITGTMVQSCYPDSHSLS